MPNSTFKAKVGRALLLAENMEHIQHIEFRVRKTPAINRMTKAGQEFTRELLQLINNRGVELMDTTQPF